MSTRDHRVIITLFALATSLMVLLSAKAAPPLVPIARLSSFDGGSVVMILGVVVDMSLRDSGSECVIIADIADGATVRVFCDPGLHDPPSHCLSVGDEVRVRGQVAGSGSPLTVFASSDAVSLTRKAETSLSVEAVCRNWVLFEGDSFKVSGLVVPEPSTDGYRLEDPVTGQSISLRLGSPDASMCLGKRVTIAAILRLDSDTMSLYLMASSVSRGAA